MLIAVLRAVLCLCGLLVCVEMMRVSVSPYGVNMCTQLCDFSDCQLTYTPSQLQCSLTFTKLTTVLRKHIRLYQRRVKPIIKSLSKATEDIFTVSSATEESLSTFSKLAVNKMKHARPYQNIQGRAKSIIKPVSKATEDIFTVGPTTEERLPTFSELTGNKMKHARLYQNIQGRAKPFTRTSSKAPNGIFIVSQATKQRIYQFNFKTKAITEYDKRTVTWVSSLAYSRKTHTLFMAFPVLGTVDAVQNGHLLTVLKQNLSRVTHLTYDDNCQKFFFLKSTPTFLGKAKALGCVTYEGKDFKSIKARSTFNDMALNERSKIIYSVTRTTVLAFDYDLKPTNSIAIGLVKAISFDISSEVLVLLTGDRVIRYSESMRYLNTVEMTLVGVGDMVVYDGVYYVTSVVDATLVVMETNGRRTEVTLPSGKVNSALCLY